MKHWDDIRHFLAIVRTGTLLSAANELGVDQSTVFRRLRSLENYLGAKLFDRRRRGHYELTQAGKNLVDQAGRIEDAMHDIEHSIRGKDTQLRGTIRIATAEDIAVVMLPPHLEAFERQHPEISIELLTANRYYSLARNEADVAIRPGHSTDEDRVIPQRICRTFMGLFASNDYLERNGIPRTREELSNLIFIEWREELARVELTREAAAWFGGKQHHGSNSLLSIRELAVRGFGVAMLPEFLGADESRLRRVLPQTRINEGEFWILHHSEMRHLARVRVFIRFMLDALRGDTRLRPIT